MTKEAKKLLNSLLSLGLIFLSFKIWKDYFKDQWWMFFVLFIIASTLPSFLLAPIPTKNTKKKRNPPTKKKSSTASTNKKQRIQNSTKKNHNLLRSEKEILTLPLDELTWREFERLCFMYYKAKGFNVEETKEGADGGVDLIYFHPKYNARVAVQIKHYSDKPITVEQIRNLDSSKKNHKCPLAEFITTTSYTKKAIREGEARRIILREKTWVENKILSWRKGEAQKRELAYSV